MYPMLATSGTSQLANVLDDAEAILASAVGIITDNTILFAIFGTSLLIAGFKVFKRAKNAVK